MMAAGTLIVVPGPLRLLRPHASEDWGDMLGAVLSRLRALAEEPARAMPPGRQGTPPALAVRECAQALSQLQQSIDPAWGQGHRLALDLLRTRVALVQALICTEPEAFALKSPHAIF